MSPFVDVRPLDAFIDVTNVPDDLEHTLACFGAYDGPRLDAAEQATLADGAAAVVRRVLAADAVGATAAAAALSGFQGTEEHAVAAAWSSGARVDGPGTLAAARAGLARNPSLPATVLLAEALWLSDLELEAVGSLAEVAEAPSLWRHRCHYRLAEIFAGHGAYDSAANHLRWYLRAGGRGDPLGGRWSTPTAAAVSAAEELLARVEAHRVVGAVARTCPACAATYLRSTRVCGLCAATYPAGAVGQPCTLCGVPVLAADDLPYCPVCRRGFPETKCAGRNVQLVARQPWGRFSVL
jgi:hypothetical protein